jgi:hypothetical protein
VYNTFRSSRINQYLVFIINRMLQDLEKMIAKKSERHNKGTTIEIYR